MKIDLCSEVGTLRSVIVHPPGRELKELIPWNRRALLIDEIIDKDLAEKEHNSFVKMIKEVGARVLYLRDLLERVLEENREEALKLIFEKPWLDKVRKKIKIDEIRCEHLIEGVRDPDVQFGDYLIRPKPNLVMSRDYGAAVPGGMLICNMRKGARGPEPRLLKAILTFHQDFDEDAVLCEVESVVTELGWRGFLEGGDVEVWNEESLAIGIGERTDDFAFERIKKELFDREKVRKIFKIPIPAKRQFMHLDTTMTMVDKHQFLVLPFLYGQPKLNGYKTGLEILMETARRCRALAHGKTRGIDPDVFRERKVEVHTRTSVKSRKTTELFELLLEENVINNIEEDLIFVAGNMNNYSSEYEYAFKVLQEQWNDAANVFAVKPGVVISYERNEKTIEALENRGIRVKRLYNGELVRARGGPRCMTMPLSREKI